MKIAQHALSLILAASIALPIAAQEQTAQEQQSYQEIAKKLSKKALHAGKVVIHGAEAAGAVVLLGYSVKEAFLPLFKNEYYSYSFSDRKIKKPKDFGFAALVLAIDIALVDILIHSIEKLNEEAGPTVKKILGKIDTAQLKDLIHHAAHHVAEKTK